ncbi:hypothetical protein D1871_16435 [Nakamurella silvestris]|nr:hypothetical protein D1871_16435 [Nakamurella silvestris]
MHQQVPDRSGLSRRAGRILVGAVGAVGAVLLVGCADTTAGSAELPGSPVSSSAPTHGTTTEVSPTPLSTVTSTAPPPPPVTATVTVTPAPATTEPEPPTPSSTHPATTNPSSSPETTRPNATRPSTTRPTTPSTPANGKDLTGANTPYGSLGFSSPSGNIGCDISADSSVRCDIAAYTYSLPSGMEACDFGNRGNALMVEPGHNGYFPCVSDTVLTTSSPVLAYGRTATLGDITCTSAETGVTCTDRASGHGFRIAKASYKLF